MSVVPTKVPLISRPKLIFLHLLLVKRKKESGLYRVIVYFRFARSKKSP